MAKHTIKFIAALLLALLGLAATVTTTTTEEEEEENTGKFPQCRQQVEGRNFRYCQMFLMQRTTNYNNDETLLNMVVTSPNRREQTPFKKECCQQLRGINSQCVCDAVRHMVKQQKGEQTEKMKKKAAKLPRMCNLRKQLCPRY